MTFVAFKERDVEERVEGRKNEKQQKCRLSWSKPAYRFIERVDHYKNVTGFFSLHRAIKKLSLSYIYDNSFIFVHS